MLFSYSKVLKSLNEEEKDELPEEYKPDTNEKEIRSVKSIKEFCQSTGIKYEQRIRIKLPEHQNQDKIQGQ